MSRLAANLLGHAVMAGTTISRTGGTPLRLRSRYDHGGYTDAVVP
jgi:hypothetical protein